MRRPRSALSLLPAAALALLASTAAVAGHPPAPKPPAPVLISAGPAHEPSDRAGTTLLRVTFSPDGDGRDDVVRVRVRTRRGEKLLLRLAPIMRSPSLFPLPPARGRVTTVVWTGLLPDGSRYPTGSYSLRVCDAATKRCSQERVLAHLRLISLYARTALGVSAGQSVPVNVSTDRRGPTALDLVPADDVAAQGIGVARVGNGSSTYRVPRVPHGGLWLLTARNGPAVTHFPLVVHEPSLPLDDPPAHTVLVVYPYLTWRAYDLFDSNRNGQVDSWYAHPRHPVVPLYGPFEPLTSDPDAEGLEPNPESMSAFEAWMAENGLVAQHVTDVELGRIPAETLAKYAEIVFAGHTEYYEDATYAKVLRYRDDGGRVYFLQGNSFYGQAQIVGDRVWRRTYRWRTPTRSDFAMAATGFRSCCWPRWVRPVYRLAPGAVAGLPWAFAGTHLEDGDPFGVAAGEVDTVDPALSPPGTLVLASAVVPPFAPGDPESPNAWVGSRAIPYAPSWRHRQRIDVAYAQTGRGEVFSWGNTGFMQSLRYPEYGLPAAERAALARVALNVWEHFAR